MWDLPSPGLEPVSPALADRFLTTAPPGKPYPDTLKRVLISYFVDCSSIWISLMFSHDYTEVLYFFGKHTTEMVVCPSQCILGIHDVSIYYW